MNLKDLHGIEQPPSELRVLADKLDKVRVEDGFGHAMIKLEQVARRVVAVSATMPSGTALTKLGG